MTVGNWITLIVPLLGFILGCILYVLQKSIDRKNEEKRERRELYRHASVALQRVQHAFRYDSRNADAQVAAIGELEEVVAEIQVASPDTVADAWYDVPEAALELLTLLRELDDDDVDTDLEEVKEAISTFLEKKTRAISEMRQDTFGETILTAKRLKEMSDALLEMNLVMSEVSRVVIKAILK